MPPHNFFDDKCRCEKSQSSDYRYSRLDIERGYGRYLRIKVFENIDKAGYFEE